MIGLILAAALAGEPVALPDLVWTHARVVDAAGVPRLALFQPGGRVTLVDPATGAAGIQLENLTDLIGADVDGDGRVDLVQCGPSGLRTVYGTEQRTLLHEPCRAVAVVHADRTMLIAVTRQAHRFGLGVGGPVPLGPFGAPLPPGPVRAIAGGDALALVHSAGLEVWGAFGQRIVAMDGPPDGVARLPTGWAWSREGVLHGVPGSWFPGAQSLVSIDLDADGAAEPVVLHPESHLVGWQIDGAERAHLLPFAPRSLVVGDVTGDGGADLLVLGDGQLLVIPSAGPSPVPQTVERLQVAAPSRPLAGIPVPLFQATDGTLASGRIPARAAVVSGAGLAIGSTLGGAFGIGASPGGFATLERRYQGSTPWIGMDTAPLLLQIGDEAAIGHLLALSGGVGLGNAHLRTGPYLTSGIGGTGAGFRVTWLPIETRSGVLHGLEWRASAITNLRTLDPVSGEVFLSWATSVPMGGEGGFERSLPGVVSRSASERPEGVGICRRFGFSLGATAGGSAVESAWEFVGRELQFDIAATPSLSGWCESGGGPHDVFLSVDSAPWFRYRIPVDQGAADIQVRHMGSMSAGYSLGSDAVRIGPYASAGIWTLGAGARLALTPIALRKAGHHGLEARGLVLWPSAAAFEGWLMYTTWFDPRR